MKPEKSTAITSTAFYARVIDMTPGQLYDAIAYGGEFYDQGKSKIYINSKLALESEHCTQEGVFFDLEKGCIFQKKPWYEALDGGWGSGTWCLCSDGDEFNNKVVAKVLGKSPGNCPWVDHTGQHWNEAKPLSEELAEKLEFLMSN